MNKETNLLLKEADAKHASGINMLYDQQVNAMIKSMNEIRKGTLSKMGITGNMLICEFIAGMTLNELAKKYGRSDGRISQLIRGVCTDQQYQQFKRQHSENRKAKKLAKFLAYVNELKRVPCLDEISDLVPGISAYYYEFRKIAESKGFIYTGVKKRGRRRKYTTEQLLQHLKELAAVLGHTPSCNQLLAGGLFTHNMYITSFGSLKAAQKLAGLKPNDKYNSVENARRRENYISKEECMEDLKRLHAELGELPSVALLKKQGRYSISMYYSRLGGIKKMRELLELKQG